MTNILLGGPVTIPIDFLGIHTNWPSSSVVVPSISIGTGRTHDANFKTKWYGIETTAGVYDWSILDATITAYRTQGWSVIHTNYGTPSFYASTTDAAFNDRYGNSGGAAFPALDTNLNGLKAFISALVTRYNSLGGVWRTANPTLGKGIKVLEPWNEPRFDVGRIEYWWGSAPQMVDLCYAVYMTAKAVDPDIIITSPAFSGEVYCRQWLMASGAVNTGISSAQTCDALNIHSYLSMPYGYTYGGWPFDIAYGAFGIWPTVELSKRFAGDKPIYISEYGMDSTEVSSTLTSFLAESAEFRRIIFSRVMMICAAMGVRVFAPYSYQSTLCGKLDTDTNGVRAAYQLISTICGKTITKATSTIRGSVTLEFSNGTVLTV
jgi:hypothetical protein